MPSKSYSNLNDLQNDREATPWYWRLIALAASWLILGGYLILPGLYEKNPELKFSQAVLLVLVVALMTAGYSFTALLCFAVRKEIFQAEAIFLPALTSSVIGLLTIAYNFLSSRRYLWNTAAIIGTSLSITSTLMYGVLLLITHRRIVKRKEESPRNQKLWSEPSFYNNFIANTYPSALSRGNSQNSGHSQGRGNVNGSLSNTADNPFWSEDDGINHQMALLLMKSDHGPPPDAASATFRIDLPEDHEQMERIANSQELVGTPPPPRLTPPRLTPPLGTATLDGEKRVRAGSTSRDSLTARWEGRGRANSRPESVGAPSVRGHSRAMSREERRKEIELGHH
ncbi:hypothetical protein GQ43DRAFT_285952 [Delitschia confertaspora ATCC 74209]|uniref:Uncharacterized protein n=1 Tax=Delitschia confertaspora ATCC 74209 TaxID=1513339 RepID=A0A9P4JB26_9PLEO|nr:hypothetical protein GQ43DRAFT_285952 [Delitschia confertaspora ATCC 74209]